MWEGGSVLKAKIIKHDCSAQCSILYHYQISQSLQMLLCTQNVESCVFLYKCWRFLGKSYFQFSVVN